VTSVPQPRDGSELPSGVNRRQSVAVDTGPLLCFGAVTGGPRLLIDRYKGRLRWAQAVASEINNHAQRQVRSDVDRRRVAAAKLWSGARASHLGEPRVFVERAEVESLRTQVQAESKRPAKVGHDLGESETLVLATKEDAMVLMNENAARAVARRLNIRAHCTLDVLVSEYQGGRIELRALLAMREQLSAADLDPGAEWPSPCKARTLARWQTPAPA
jgi:hypothetical protein